jgi:hypothetical protein
MVMIPILGTRAVFDPATPDFVLTGNAEGVR